MKSILFITTYPNDENSKDGYVQRVKNIDNLFVDIHRIYIVISIKPWIKDEEWERNNVTFYKLNLFRNFMKIKKIIQSVSHIYIHSIYRFFPECLFFRNNQIITLDFHGIVPEEVAFSGKKIKSYFYSMIERKAIKCVDNIVCVTHAMENYIRQKYPKAKNKFIYYPIVSKNVFIDNKDIVSESTDKVVFVYSGNCQKWQRIEDIVKFINNNNYTNYRFIFLTLNQEEMKKIVYSKLTKDFCGEIEFDTVAPEELYKYYIKADYGFLIRDDHPLNRVANPTKMLEYMYYGITPIVDLINIGDYQDYDYVKYDYIGELKKGKSLRNRNISIEYLTQSYLNIRNIIF